MNLVPTWGTKDDMPYGCGWQNIGIDALLFHSLKRAVRPCLASVLPWRMASLWSHPVEIERVETANYSVTLQYHIIRFMLDPPQRTRSVNKEFVEGLDDIGKFFEGVDPPDELDVGG